MIYARNKESFRKTTQKVEYRAAAKNIIESLKIKLDGENSNTIANYASTNPTNSTHSNHAINPIKLPKTPPHLNIHHLFDIKVDHKDKCMEAIKVYIKVLEEQVQKMQGELRKTEVKEINMEQMMPESGTRELIQNFTRYFSLSKQIISANSLCLLQCKTNSNALQIDRCLIANERIMETYSTILQNAENLPSSLPFPSSPQEQEALLLYYQKTIEHLRREPPIDQIAILRANLDSLTRENEDLLSSLSQAEREADAYMELQQDYSRLKIEHMMVVNRKSMKVNQFTQCNVESPVRYNTEELDDYKFRIEKEFLMDTCAKLEDQLKAKNSRIEQLLESNSQLAAIIDSLKESQADTVNQMDILRENLTVTSDQVALMKERTKLLENERTKLLENERTKNEKQSGTPQRYNVSVREDYTPQQIIRSPKNEDITVETLLRKLNTPTTKQYYKTLLRLIEQYESKIAALRSSFVEEKSLKDALLQWGKSLCQNFSQDTLDRFPSVIKQTQITPLDKFLRVVKSLSVGLNHTEIALMEKELGEYVSNLLNRCPDLRECSQEGSSMAQDDDDFQVIE